MQEQIAEIDQEIEKLYKDKLLYQYIIEEISNEQPDYKFSDQESKISVETIEDREQKNNISKQKKTITGERQITFERARAWLLNRKRSKKTK